jgi:hypothetical protein
MLFMQHWGFYKFSKLDLSCTAKRASSHVSTKRLGALQDEQGSHEGNERHIYQLQQLRPTQGARTRQASREGRLVCMVGPQDPPRSILL